MPRRTVRKRRPTVDDLTEGQRQIHDALPEALQEEYLRQLPDIRISQAGGRKKVELIEQRIHMVDNVLRSLQAHKKHLEQLQRSLKQGADPGKIDLRQELRPPAIEGVSIRYVRTRKGTRTEEP
jgi:hypothetical protein